MPDVPLIEQCGMLVAESASRRGAEYADLRVVRISTEGISLTNGVTDLLDRQTSYGFGVRVLANGAWGFAARPGLSLKDVDAALGDAIEIAKASALLVQNQLILPKRTAVKGEYKTPFATDPFAVPLTEKVDFLQSLCGTMSATQGVTSSEAFLDFRREEKWFFDSYGSQITQMILHSGGGINAAARQGRHGGGSRSYPTSGGQHVSGGYEAILALKLEDACRRVAEEAVALMNAPALPEMTTNLILSGDLVSLQIHESIGHPLELDRVFGSERNFSGTSFATPDQVGSLKYGSDIVTVTCDPTAPGGLGTYGYDDEGVETYQAPLIDQGVLVNYLSSRESAQRIGKQSTAAMRAESWRDLPLVRMANTNLRPGFGTLEELIADTDEGVLIETPANWSIDDRRENFQLGGEIAWEIKNGQRGQMYGNAVYSGNTVAFWNSCERICGPEEWRIWGTPNCGKGQPGQNMRTGQGASPARFTKIKVGQSG
ncbi:MAG: TldD/PmbA family protein [Candidatus Zixiibacteriota bacterium]